MDRRAVILDHVLALALIAVLIAVILSPPGRTFVSKVNAHLWTQATCADCLPAPRPS